jgi:dihydrofolate synthase/folylpolyglutamate synthase
MANLLDNQDIEQAYVKTLDYLYSQLPMFHRIGPAAYKPGLQNTIDLLAIVGNPEMELKCVHVAGTNGKGSTSHLMASVCQEAGYKTGLYTSPHLIDFRERIRINGEMISKKDVVHFVEQFKDEWSTIQPSFFEITVALAFWHFKKENVDISIIETGLGGRLDSTNVILPEVSVITRIGLDHMNLLGDTIEKIAGEKAGIIKEKTPVILGMMPEVAKEVCLQKAIEKNSEVFLANAEVEVLSSPLKGKYQLENHRTALTALRVLGKVGWTLSEENIRSGFEKVIANTGLMGRWQILSEKPLIIADVAHNEDGISSVLSQVSELTYKRLHIVLGMVSDKDISKVLQLFPKEASYYFCKANIPRGMDAGELQKMANEFGLQGRTYSSVRDAYHGAIAQMSPDDLTLVTGSFFTVAEVL